MEEYQQTEMDQEICPNCLEPNSKGLANCTFCGMPLGPGAASVEALSSVPDDQGGSETLASAAAPAENTKTSQPQRSAQDKKKGRGFTYAMRGMGVYLIVVSVTEIPRSLKIEEAGDRRLALISNLIYLVAGCLMAWPLLKDYLDKRKGNQPTDSVNEPPIQVAAPVTNPDEIIDLEPDAVKSVEEAQPSDAADSEAVLPENDSAE